MELYVLRSLLTGATQTAFGVGRQHMRPSLACPYCHGQVQETGRHILWGYPRWASARDDWLLLVCATAAAMPTLGQVDQWPACLQNVFVVPVGSQRRSTSRW